MKLDKRSIPYKTGKGGLILAAIFATSVSSLNPLIFLIGGLFFLLVFMFILVYQYLHWKNFEYEITDDSFDIRSGIISRQTREIPIHRIQNIDISHNLIERILGISQVNIETAGGGQTEASLKYVSEEDAKTIQDRVSRRKRSIEEEEAGDDQPMFKLDNRELALLSVFSIDLRAVAGILFLFSLGGGFFTAGPEQYQTVSVLITMILFLVTVLAVWTASALSTFARYYGFKIFDRGNELRYERGLIQEFKGSIPKEKIQSLTFEENPLMRYFGFSSLKIETAGYSAETSLQKGAEAAVPIATRNKALKLGKDIEKFSEPELNPISRDAKKRYWFRYSMTATLLLTGGFLTDLHITDFNYVLLLTLYPLAFLAGEIKWRNRGYQEQQNHFITMNGFWNRRTSIVPYYRLQNLITSSTIFQRRLDLENLTFDVAGTDGILTRNPEIFDLNRKTSEKLRESIFESFRNSKLDKK